MTAQQLVHPDPQTLREFNVGRLADPEVDAIERHLADCPPCCDTLAGLQNDTFVSLVREADTASAAGSPSWSVEPTLVGHDAADLPGDVPAELAEHARYRVLELLGRGGMGAVYQAEHRLMQRAVALKVVNPRLTGHPGAVERFRREVRTAARLQHPNIVTAHDAEQAGGLHFMVMEYVDGIDLAELVRRRGPLPVAEGCEYIRQAALGLQHAHEQGMVHRDIKPQNLMVEGRGLRVEGEDTTGVRSSFNPQPSTIHPQPSIKILDFGLAHFASEATTHGGLTEANAMMGTPDYMAPEQARDAHAADIRADIYSLGCTLYFLLTGQPPFPQGTVVQKVMAHTERRPEPLTTFRNDLPAGLQRVLDRMLAKAPADRYQTPAEVAHALTPFAGAAAAVPLPRSKVLRAAIAAAALLLLLAGTVITVATDKGTLRIEYPPDANVEVTVSRDGELQAVDRPSDTTVHRLPSGEYDVELKGDTRFRLEKDEFTLTRGETVILRITRVGDDQVLSDQKRLRGTWYLRSSKGPANAEFPSSIQFEDPQVARLTVGSEEHEGSFKLDPSQRPGHIDFISSTLPGVTQGIYKFEGEFLYLAIPSDSNSSRPTNFSGPLVGTSVMVLARRARESDAGLIPDVRNDQATQQPAAGQPVSPHNLVANPGFEDAAAPGGPPAYWIALPKTTALEPEAVCVRDTDMAQQGQASAAIEKPKMAFPVAEAGFLQTIPDLPPGRLFLSGYVKTRDVKGAAAIKLRIVDPAKGPVPVKWVETTAVNATTEWMRCFAEIDVPAGTVGELSLVIQGTGTAWFDEISLVPLENLLENGGFDQLDENGRPTAWQPVGLGVDGLTFDSSREVIGRKDDRRNAAKRSATITSTTGGFEPYNWRQEINATDLRGRTLVLSGWARTTDATGAAVGVQLLDAAGRLIGFHTTQGKVDYAGTVHWRRFELEFAVPAGAERIAVLAMIFGKGQAWFDEFRLKPPDAPEDTARPATPNPGARASAEDPVRSIDRLDDEGFSKLHRAAMSGNIELVQELLAEEADPNVQQGTYEGTPLQYAAAQGHVDIARLLIKHGAEVDATDTQDRTPLMWAAMNGRTEAVAALLDAKADIEARNNGGWTPLRFALSEGHDDTAKLLIDRGAKQPAEPPATGEPLDTPAEPGRTEPRERPAAAQSDANPAADAERQTRVTGRLISSEYANRDGRIERAIVYVRDLATDRQVFSSVFRTDRFEFDLPPGRYRAEYTANGSRGATFVPTSKEFSVASTEEPLDLGEIDLPITRTTALFDKPAPELEGIVAWWNTQPVRLADLRGKVVVLDFFSYTCSICHAHKPDLAKLREKYGDRGLAVLAIHDDSLKTLAELTEHMGPILHRVFDGNVPRIPMALDNSGEQSVFRTYGIGAVPAVLLIDQEGHVVQRFHHAGKPELAEEIDKLMDRASGPARRQL